MQSPFNPYMGMASRSPFYDMLSMPLMSGDTNNAGLGPSTGQTNNDTMFGGMDDKSVQSKFGTDTLFNDKFNDVFNNNKPAAPTDKMNQVFNNAPPRSPVAPAASVVPGLPSAPAVGSGPSQADIDAAHNAPAGVPGSQHNSPNAVGGMIGGAEAAAAAAAESAAAAGVPGSEQNSPNSVGGMMGGMANTGVTPSGENGFGGGMGMGGGGGDGGGGNSGGPNGVGNPGDAGSGTPGAGQSGEGGQWRKGTSNTGDDGDMDLDEPVKGQVHENEGVLTRHANKGLGRKFVEAANREFKKKGADRKAVLKKIAPLMGKD